MFSSKSDNYDTDGVFKVIDTNISWFNGKGYGIKYLLECLKVDDLEYYKNITTKGIILMVLMMIGASEIVFNHYKNLLIICEGILYVYDNNIWVDNEKQVDKLWIDMIGSLDIMFYCIDGKRIYHYNKSIKHIKDCIVCIEANKTIVNDKFCDDMIRIINTIFLIKLMMVFILLEKKLYKYSELPYIHFTFKINRIFLNLIKKSMMA